MESITKNSLKGRTFGKQEKRLDHLNPNEFNISDKGSFVVKIKNMINQDDKLHSLFKDQISEIFTGY